MFVPLLLEFSTLVTRIEESLNSNILIKNIDILRGRTVIFGFSQLERSE